MYARAVTSRSDSLSCLSMYHPWPTALPRLHSILLYIAVLYHTYSIDWHEGVWWSQHYIKIADNLRIRYTSLLPLWDTPPLPPPPPPTPPPKIPPRTIWMRCDARYTGCTTRCDTQGGGMFYNSKVTRPRCYPVRFSLACEYKRWVKQRNNPSSDTA